MSTATYLQSGSQKVASVVRTALAASVIRLIGNPLVITPLTTKATLVANEADYDGYVEVSVSAFDAAYLDPAGGSTISSGYFQPAYGPAASPPVTNNIYGLWLEDAAGDVIIVFMFDSPVPMDEVGQVVPINVLLNYGR